MEEYKSINVFANKVEKSYNEKTHVFKKGNVSKTFLEKFYAWLKF